MQIRLYINEDAMLRALINGLRARDVDLKTVSEMDTRKLDDEAQLKFAASQGRVLYTF